MPTNDPAPLFPAAAYNRYATTGDLDLRLVNDTLCLWRLCGKKACLRARACRGRDPADCGLRCRRLAPEGAQNFIEGIYETYGCGLTFEQVMEELADEAAALRAWHAQVQRSLLPYGGIGRPGRRA